MSNRRCVLYYANPRLWQLCIQAIGPYDSIAGFAAVVGRASADAGETSSGSEALDGL